MKRDISYWATVDPGELSDEMRSESVRGQVLRVLSALTRDATYTDLVAERVRGGILDVRLAIAWLAERLEAESYLEIGVRRGFTLAAFASVRPSATVYAFDLWVRNYAGAANPGPRFVSGELARVGFAGRAFFVNGNSHETLPVLFGTSQGGWRVRRRLADVPRPGAPFDLILVDGDHSILGAYQDLRDVMPRCAVGGVVVFDDIAPDLARISEADRRKVRKELGADPHGWGGLHGVWRAIQPEFPDFRYFEYVEDSPGLALAVRLR